MANGNGGEAGRVAKLNQLTRSLVVWTLVAAFSVGFVSVLWTGKVVVSTDAFGLVLGVALAWLFKSRDEQQKAEEMKDAVKAATVAPPPAGATTPPAVPGG